MKPASKKKTPNRREVTYNNKVPSMRNTVDEFLKNNPAIAQARENWQARIDKKLDDLSDILERNRMSTQKQLDLISELTTMVSSGGRLELFLDIASHIIAAETFWPAFHRVWPICDDTWLLRDKLYRTISLFKYCRPCDSLLKDNADFFKALPASISIYRGCSRGRARGFSWTTDRQIALGFSKGHRGIEVPNPVVCSAKIRKCDVFSASVQRKEQELVIDYKKLRDLKIVATLEEVKR
jgi:hypothetical protein